MLEPNPQHFRYFASRLFCRVFSIRCEQAKTKMNQVLSLQPSAEVIFSDFGLVINHQYRIKSFLLIPAPCRTCSQLFRPCRHTSIKNATMLNFLSLLPCRTGAILTFSSCNQAMINYFIILSCKNKVILGKTNLITSRQQRTESFPANSTPLPCRNEITLSLLS